MIKLSDELFERLEAESLREENKRLAMENKKLLRELRYERLNGKRNMVRAEAMESLSKAILTEKSKLDIYMRLLLSNSPSMIMFFNSDGRLAFASDSYLKKSGVQGFGLIEGKTYREVFEPVAGYEFMRLADLLSKIVLAEKQPLEIEQDIDFRACGDNRHYLIQAAPMLDESGSFMGVIIFFNDTTEIIRAKQEAERAREAAEQSTKAKSDFLSRMSHEMRTPMNAIIGMTSIARASRDPQRKEYCLDKINDASVHLLGVINDILDMSKIESGKFELAESSFNFGDMLRRIVNVINFRVDERRQTLDTEIDGNIPDNIISDEQRLAQVITNLLANAVKFTPERGRIVMSAREIAAEGASRTIRFSVRDNGIGISLEQQSRLFTLFEQADGSISRKFGGTGLGLAISKKIVELMGGRIWIESELGEGSNFIFEITVKEGEKPAADARSSHESGVALSEDGIFLNKRVLMAEDVEINCEVLSSLIEHTGTLIDFASDGGVALEKFSRDPNRYDLILMDVHMPNVDGYEATRRIRVSGLPRAAEIPIIAMTANVFREDVERCLAAGMNGHLGKPINAAEVIAKLREYLT